MKSFTHFVFGVFVVLFLGACAATPPLPPEYSYGKDAIHVNLDADPLLNLNEGSAHTLLICVHQLSDPNAFNRLIGDTNGIYRFLECSQFDPSVTHSKRIIVQPDQKVTYTLDRAEGTKYVAVGGGYYNVRKDDVIRLFEIPIVEKSLGALSRTRIAEPGILNIDLDLGPTAIKDTIKEK
ncbi:MAG: type VI secretion system lipoprotein TssJ [Desulfobulbaceae bacterium]|nr:type VI secretion system lipoprotein TssJ [Desulfobulbaceae bacterium]